MAIENTFKSVTQGDDGRNYDDHLEHLFHVLIANDFSERDVIIHNLKLYSHTFCSVPPPLDETVLDDTEETIKWAGSISGIQIWRLTDHQKEAHSIRSDHEFGAYMIGGSQPVTAHTPRAAILLAVVQRFREVASVELNPVRSVSEKIH